MATPGYISLQFNATYLGDYRVCWRLGPVGPYTCFTINCGSLGLCTAYITPLNFPINTCDTVNYNGYVQASCENPASTDGAVFWSVDYEPEPACKPWEITCLGSVTASTFEIEVKTSGQLAFIPTNITSQAFECLCGLDPLWNANSQYNQNLTISPWGNTLTEIMAWDPLTQSASSQPWIPGTIFCGRFIGDGAWQNQITQIVQDPCGVTGNYSPAASSAQFGSQCIYKPIITISSPPPGGTQATAEAVMGFGGLLPSNLTMIITNPGNIAGTPGTYTVWNTNPANGRGRNLFQVVVGPSGFVTSVTPIRIPYGYGFSSQSEFISFAPATIGGVQGVLVEKPPGINSTDYGQVIDVVITNQGSGYVSTPTVSFVTANCYNPLSVNVSIAVNSTTGGIGPCPSFTPGDGCGIPSDQQAVVVPSLPIGSTFTLCYPFDVTTPPWNLDENDWSINDDSDKCCYDCVKINIVSTPQNPNPQIVYTDCNTQNVTVFTMSSNFVQLNCVVRNSWVSTSSDTAFYITGNCI